MLSKPVVDLFKDYGWLIACAVLGCIWIYFSARKAKWCPKCRKPSCEKLGPKSNSDMQAMRCKFCGFNKTIYTSSHIHSVPPD